MISNVVVALDGSEVADRALVPAVQLAARAGAGLVLLGAPTDEVDADGIARRLDARVALLEVQAETRVVASGAVDAIVAAAGEPGTLVCMSTRGLGAVRAAVLGSVAEAVLRASTGAVVLVGASFAVDWQLAEHPVVVAGVDHSECAARAAYAAAELAAAIGGRVQLLEARGHEAAGAEVEHDARLAALVDAVRARGVAADGEALSWPEAVALLLERSADSPGGLLAVGTHGRTGIRRIALGSVAMRVVQHATCPVLVAGPNARA